MTTSREERHLRIFGTHRVLFSAGEPLFPSAVSEKAWFLLSLSSGSRCSIFKRGWLGFHQGVHGPSAILPRYEFSQAPAKRLFRNCPYSIRAGRLMPDLYFGIQLKAPPSYSAGTGLHRRTVPPRARFTPFRASRERGARPAYRLLGTQHGSKRALLTVAGTSITMYCAPRSPGTGPPSWSSRVRWG
jgi:hypothetical protein